MQCPPAVLGSGWAGSVGIACGVLTPEMLQNDSSFDAQDILQKEDWQTKINVTADSVKDMDALRKSYTPFGHFGARVAALVLCCISESNS